MDRDVLVAIRDLLTRRRVLSLAVLVDGEPEAGLLPYALRKDYGAVFVQASDMARHARGLREARQVGILVHANDTPDEDPMQLARLVVQASVRLLERGRDEFTSASERFMQRFPSAQMTLSLGDFNLYELALVRGRYIEGFARASDVSADTFREIAALSV